MHDVLIYKTVLYKEVEATDIFKSIYIVCNVETNPPENDIVDVEMCQVNNQPKCVVIGSM
jgi:hypothetical protein